MMETFLQDMRYGMRMMAKRRGFTLVAVLALALGIGANSAIFSVVNSVLLLPLPFPQSERLVALSATPMDQPGRENPTSTANFIDWKEQSQTVGQMTAATLWSPALTGRGKPEQLKGLRATADLFQLLGVEAMLVGRTFLPENGVSGEDRVAVLGYAFWQRRFGGDERLVGQKIILDGEPFTVLGIMPPGFQFPPFWATDTEIWVPLVFGTNLAGTKNFLQQVDNRSGG